MDQAHGATLVSQGDVRYVGCTTRPRPRRPGSGFTLIELALVLSLMVIFTSLVLPALERQIWRGKLISRCEEIAVHLSVARMEAMKQGTPVVVRPDYARQTLVAFLDADDDLSQDPGEREVYSLLPGSGGHREIRFRGPTGAAGTSDDPAQSVDGLTALGGESLLRVAVFEPDGSIRNSGAFRIADDRPARRNAFELRMAPKSTARVELRKYVYGGPGGDGFYPAGGGLWEWY